MKPRPRQIDNTKPFIIIENYEKFKQEEGQDNDQLLACSIITPNLLDQTKEIKVPPLPKNERITIQPQSPMPFKRIRPEFAHYKYEPYPDGNKFELTQENLKFLQIINEKYNVQIFPDDFQRYIEVLDLKSGKDTILDFSSCSTMLLRELPHNITRLSESVQFDLHAYWKKAREELKRPFLRSLMHPDFDDTNPHLAFRSRNPPQERKIYTRGRNPQTKTFSEMEVMSQKIVNIKEDLMKANELFQKLVLREKGFEIDRRVSFIKFIREVAQLYSQTFNPTELTIWNKECFVDMEFDMRHQKKETGSTLVNIIKNENNVKSEETPLSKIFGSLKMDIENWKRSEEQQIFKQDAIIKLENDFKMITSKHRQAINIPVIVEPDIVSNFQESQQIRNPRPVKQRVHDDIRENKDFMNREYIEERRDSVAKYISTLYLEGRKLGLNLDKVLAETESLANFVPIRAEVVIPIQKQILVTPLKGCFKEIPEIISIPQKVDMLQYYQVKIGKFIYRLKENHYMVQKLLKRKQLVQYQQQLPNDSLLKKWKLLQKRTEKLLEISDIDQMLYNEQLDDEKHDEEQFKLIRKKLKSFQTKVSGTSLSMTNGLVKNN